MSRVHPDDLVRRAHWAPMAKIPAASRRVSTVPFCAPTCKRKGCVSASWVLKTTTGHGKEKRKLPEPIPVCMRCGEEWETFDVVHHMVTGVPGSGITKRGRWTRYMHVKSSRGGVARSNEERLFGDRDVHELLKLRELVLELNRSRRHYWAARVYFAYVLHFSAVKARGGQRALAVWAGKKATGEHRPGAWPVAPFEWNRDRVIVLVAAGREAWVRLLVREKLIEGGEWWRQAEEAKAEDPVITGNPRTSFRFPGDTLPPEG